MARDVHLDLIATSPRNAPTVTDYPKTTKWLRANAHTVTRNLLLMMATARMDLKTLTHQEPTLDAHSLRNQPMDVELNALSATLVLKQANLVALSASTRATKAVPLESVNTQ